MKMRYLLVNKQPGPRGVQTAAAGVVMVHPSLNGAKNGVEAELTEEEVDMAEAAGLEVEEVQGSNITGSQTSNLPAAGQVDPNTEEGEKLLAKQNREAAKRAAAASAPKSNAAPKTASGGVNNGTPAGGTSGGNGGSGGNSTGGDSANASGNAAKAATNSTAGKAK